MSTSISRETSDLLYPVVERLTAFLAKADTQCESFDRNETEILPSTTLVPTESLSPIILERKISNSLQITREGTGQDGLLSVLEDILKYSVNTSAQGFMDKLTSAPLPPGVAAELILAVLNTNLHVYTVSPVLTLVEKHVSRTLATMFGFQGPRAGGISVQGGSASNLTSIVAARNSLFPLTKIGGNGCENSGKLILFTSAHGHFSIEKAAQALGLGSKNVVGVPVDQQGRMIPNELKRLIVEAKAAGNLPFYINATAGTTVLGSFDLFKEIAVIAKEFRCWLHVDGAWGGSYIFTKRPEMRARLDGIEEADSIGINPHKMLGVPIPCSFLLVRDLYLLKSAMTLKAGYLFHEIPVGNDDETDDEEHNDYGREVTSDENQTYTTPKRNGILCEVNAEQELRALKSSTVPFDEESLSSWAEPYDLADLTLQCGRRGDSLKLLLSLQYYGTEGYQKMIESAHDLALKMAHLVNITDDFTPVLSKCMQPECLQVCFYYTPGEKFVFGTYDHEGHLSPRVQQQNGTTETSKLIREQIGVHNTLVTAKMSRSLVRRGFMVDFAPALAGQEDRGSFFRVVVNISTIEETVVRLLQELSVVGRNTVRAMSKSYPAVL